MLQIDIGGYLIKLVYIRLREGISDNSFPPRELSQNTADTLHPYLPKIGAEMSMVGWG